MKNRLRVFIAVLAVASVHAFGQTRACETVYETVDNSPAYDGGTNEIMKYSIKYLTPIISKYHAKDPELSGKLTMMLTIDTDGKVVDAVLSNHKLPKDCVDDIKKQLLTMTGWTPGSLNGQKVCSKIGWAIGGIKWG